MTQTAYCGANIFDGQELNVDMALLLQGDVFRGLVRPSAIPQNYRRIDLAGGVLMPGFVDLQVNGGGGVMFNDETSVSGLIAMANAHHSTGTRALLPTLITDTRDRSRAAVDAVAQAIKDGVPGVIGLHLEGPHLSLARKGAHDPRLIRKMDHADEDFLCDAAQRLPNIMVTLAPENVTNAQIKRLSQAGVIVSLGHSDCSFAAAEAAFAAGATCVTHLFNAMSQIGNREPGLVGATINTRSVSAGLIADEVHVHAASIRLAMAAKRGPGRLFLVTDAMSTTGADITEFTLNGRRVLRRDGCLRLEDGTLAGADLDFPKAISVLIAKAGIAPARAYAMATSCPASILAEPFGYGSFTIGQNWHGVYLDANGHSQPLNGVAA